MQRVPKFIDQAKLLSLPILLLFSMIIVAVVLNAIGVSVAFGLGSTDCADAFPSCFFGFRGDP